MSIRETTKEGLSVGDAMAIIALLVFIFGWLTGWIVILNRADPKDYRGDFAAWVILMLIIWPPIWAGRLIAHIVRRGDNR